MAIPLILAIGGRVAFTVIARAIAANRAKAVVKYGAKAVKEAIKIAKTTKSSDKAVINAAKKLVKNPKFIKKPKSVLPKTPQKRKKITGNVKPAKTTKTKKQAKPPKSVLPKTPQKRRGGSKPKPTKPKPSKLPTKPQTRKGGSKPTKTKPKTNPKSKSKVKPKPPFTPKGGKPVVKGGKLAKALPAIVGGGLLLGGLVASMRGKKKDGVKVTVRDKPQRDTKFTGKIPPKNITKSVLPKKEQKRTGGSKPTMKISSFEDRVRAMVAKKDSLKNIDAADGSGRNKYQVEMNRLKKENPKEFRKLFTLGGLGKLKD